LRKQGGRLRVAGARSPAARLPHEVGRLRLECVGELDNARVRRVLVAAQPPTDRARLAPDPAGEVGRSPIPSGNLLWNPREVEPQGPTGIHGPMLPCGTFGG